MLYYLKTMKVTSGRILLQILVPLLTPVYLDPVVMNAGFARTWKVNQLPSPEILTNATETYLSVYLGYSHSDRSLEWVLQRSAMKLPIVVKQLFVCSTISV